MLLKACFIVIEIKRLLEAMKSKNKRQWLSCYYGLVRMRKSLASISLNQNCRVLRAAWHIVLVPLNDKQRKVAHIDTH